MSVVFYYPEDLPKLRQEDLEKYFGDSSTKSKALVSKEQDSEKAIEAIEIQKNETSVLNTETKNEEVEVEEISLKPRNAEVTQDKVLDKSTNVEFTLSLPNFIPYIFTIVLTTVIVLVIGTSTTNILDDWKNEEIQLADDRVTAISQDIQSITQEIQQLTDDLN